MPDTDVRDAAGIAALKNYLETYRLTWFTPMQLNNALFEHLGFRPDYLSQEKWLHVQAEMGLIERSIDGRQYRAGPLSPSLEEFSRKLKEMGEHNVQLNREQAAKLRAWLATPNGSCSLGDRLTVESVEGGGLLVRTRPWRVRQ